MRKWIRMRLRRNAPGKSFGSWLLCSSGFAVLAAMPMLLSNAGGPPPCRSEPRLFPLESIANARPLPLPQPLEHHTSARRSQLAQQRPHGEAIPVVQAEGVRSFAPQSSIDAPLNHEGTHVMLAFRRLPPVSPR